MIRVTDKELLDELKKRFDKIQKALYDHREMSKLLKKINKQLQESEALKSNFLSNIRNEMNDPLASIIGLSSQLLLKRSFDKKTITVIAEMIHSEAFNLDFQLNNIFAAAEIEAGEVQLDISTADINAIVNNTLKSFQYKTAEKNLNVSFTCNCPGKEPLFQTDSAKLYLVISNLLSNAIEYSHTGGKIKVKVSIRNDSLSLSVQDFGQGIKKTDQKNIFERFKQLESGSTRSHKGQGIGITVVKSIIEIMNGKVTVSSEKKKGSTFKVVIPKTEFDEDVFSSAKNEFFYEEKEL